MAVKTQGTQLFILDPDTTGGPSVLAIDCVTALSGLGAEREQIEVTCLENDARTYVGGLQTPGQLTVTVNFDPNVESHYRIYELWKANTNFKFAIAFGDGTAVPTVDTAGEFVFATTRTYIEAEGYVSDLPLEASLNSVWTAAIPVQVSGEYTIWRKV